MMLVVCAAAMRVLWEQLQLRRTISSDHNTESIDHRERDNHLKVILKREESIICSHKVLTETQFLVRTVYLYCERIIGIGLARV